MIMITKGIIIVHFNDANENQVDNDNDDDADHETVDIHRNDADDSYNDDNRLGI